MSDPLIRECDNYVVLEPGAREKILTQDETLTWLQNWLNKLEDLPKDLRNQESAQAAAQYLLDTACELEIHPGFTLKWFAIRLNPPSEQ